MRLNLNNYVVEIKGEEVITTMSNGRQCSSGEQMEIIKLLMEKLHPVLPPIADAEFDEESVNLQMTALTSQIMAGTLLLAVGRVRGSTDPCLIMVMQSPDGPEMLPVGSLIPAVDPIEYYEANFKVGDPKSLN